MRGFSFTGYDSNRYNMIYDYATPGVFLGGCSIAKGC